MIVRPVVDVRACILVVSVTIDEVGCKGFICDSFNAIVYQNLTLNLFCCNVVSLIVKEDETLIRHHRNFWDDCSLIGWFMSCAFFFNCWLGQFDGRFNPRFKF